MPTNPQGGKAVAIKETVRVTNEEKKSQVSPEEEQIMVIQQADDKLDLVLQEPKEVDLEISEEQTILTVSDSRPDAHFIYDQAIPSDLWIVNHTLNKHPAVTVVDSAGNEVEGGVHYVSNSTIELSFTAPFGGIAYLN